MTEVKTLTKFQKAEIEKSSYIRTMYAALKVASEMACQIKHTTMHREKAAAKQIETQIDDYIKLVERSFKKRNGQDELDSMNKVFDHTTAFMGEVLAVASIVPNDDELQGRILEAFTEICKHEFSK